MAGYPADHVFISPAEPGAIFRVLLEFSRTLACA
jgi:hypothetical protein